MPQHQSNHGRPVLLAGLLLSILAALPAQAQSRIQNMPGYENWEAIAPNISSAIRTGRITPEWAPNSRSFTYKRDGETWRYTIRNRRNELLDPPAEEPKTTGEDVHASTTRPPPLVLARGRGADTNKISPDGQRRAFTRDMNLFVSDPDGGNELQITTDGGPSERIRNGVGSYVYLEEFGTEEPVWWSPDSSKLAWMRYDERNVSDYVLALDQTKTFSKPHIQAYPHPGEPNPIADLMVHDLETGETRRMAIRDGQPFSNNVVGHYVWKAQWTHNGDEILVRRAERLQKIYDLAACNAATGSCRTVVREERPNAWAQGEAPNFLDDGERFIWTSERNGFRNLYLYNLDGELIAALTQHDFDVRAILDIDERRGEVWYTAWSGDNHMKSQLHRVSLSGRNDRRLTDPAYRHTVSVSPDFRYFVDNAETHDKPPVSTIHTRNGDKIGDVVLADLTAFDELGLNRAENFTFTSADGVTELHGQLVYPSNFDPQRKWPLLLSVYAGPSTNGVSERFRRPDAFAEYGFVVARLDARSASARGRDFIDAIYQQLGVAEIDDLAAGVRSLHDREWLAKDRVGVFGTSYGGTASAMLLMRYPDLFQAAVSNSPVTDWMLYDSAYTERYLGLPEDSPQAYEQGSVINQVENLEGDLMLYFGTSDDNVHPKNALQLIQALNKAKKSYDVQVGPDRGHTSLPQDRMMEFFIEKLVINPSRTD